MAENLEQSWRVFFRWKVEKQVAKMPRREQAMFANLVEDLIQKGPIRTEWRNFSKLSDREYHCHLSYSWVACRRVENQELEIEVYYAGSREKAPYLGLREKSVVRWYDSCATSTVRSKS